MHLAGNVVDLAGGEVHAADVTELSRAEDRALFVSDGFGAVDVVRTSAEEAYDAVLDGGGASASVSCDGTWTVRRDGADARAVQEVRDRVQRIVHHPAEVGGWPSLSGGAACVDGDGDGMPSAFEMRYGFDDSEPSDALEDTDGDGYLNVEEFLNGSRPRM